MNENNPIPETAALPTLDVRVHPITPVNNLIGFASVTISNAFAVNGIRIFAGDKGLFLGMPSRQDDQGNWRDVFLPITKEAHKVLSDAVVGEYKSAMERMQTQLDGINKAAERSSIADALKEGVSRQGDTPRHPKTPTDITR